MTQLDRPKLWTAIQEAPKLSEREEELLYELELESCQPSPYFRSPKAKEGN